jgi:hypothetical protein
MPAASAIYEFVLQGKLQSSSDSISQRSASNWVIARSCQLLMLLSALRRAREQKQASHYAIIPSGSVNQLHRSSRVRASWHLDGAPGQFL